MKRKPNAQPHNSGLRTLRWLLGVLLVLNLFFMLLRAQFGPVAQWPAVRQFVSAPLAETAQAVGEEANTHTEQVKTLELLRPNEIAREGEDAIELADNSLCVFLGLGVEADPQQMASLRQRLAAVGVPATVVLVEAELLRKHVVFLGSVTAADLESALRGLLAKNINAFIVTLQDGRRVAALGVYDLQLMADEALHAFKEKGFTVEQGIYSELTEQPMLMLSPSHKGRVSERLWAGLRKDFPGLGRYEKYCQSVASPS
ncbi:MAG: hypothetical protein KJO62_09915 [Gammaproteobacteria bacterium]|nr:hypothetical protein [Gammaproteobacteria bacterium]